MLWDGFLQWVSNLTLWDFLLIFWLLILIDLTRSLGKPLFLIIHDLYCSHKCRKNTLIFKPKVSIIIPAHNEEKSIVKSIESALNSDYPNKEIIVVDDGSKDKTAFLASLYASNGSIKLVRRDYSSGSKAGALNYGILFASGDVLVTVDADTLVESDGISKLVNELADSDVSAVSGNVRILCGDSGKRNLLVRLQEYEYFLAFELGRRFSSIMGIMMIISGAFGAFRSAEMKALGQYDKDTITEDFDLTLKLRKLRKKLIYNNKAVSWTFAPDTLRSWRNQRIRWTKGEAETLWKHRNFLKIRGFDFTSVASTYDMLFSDVVLLVLRFAWLGSLFFIFPTSIIYVLIFSLIMYLIIESVGTMLAAFLSRDKRNLKYLLYVPIMVLVYRPYYSLVRLIAYFNWLFKKKTDW